jgi:hypothetical protein
MLSIAGEAHDAPIDNLSQQTTLLRTPSADDGPMVAAYVAQERLLLKSADLRSTHARNKQRARLHEAA